MGCGLAARQVTSVNESVKEAEALLTPSTVAAI